MTSHPSHHLSPSSPYAYGQSLGEHSLRDASLSGSTPPVLGQSTMGDSGEVRPSHPSTADSSDADGYTEGGLALLRLLNLKVRPSSSEGGHSQPTLMQMQRESSFADIPGSTLPNMSSRGGLPQNDMQLTGQNQGQGGTARVMSVIGSGRSPTATPPPVGGSAPPGPAEQAMQTGLNPMMAPLNLTSSSSTLWPSPFSIPAKLNTTQSPKKASTWEPEKPSLVPSFTAWFDNFGPSPGEVAQPHLPLLGRPSQEEATRDDFHANHEQLPPPLPPPPPPLPPPPPSAADLHPLGQPPPLPLSPRSRDAFLLKRQLQLQAEHMERLQQQAQQRQQAHQRLLYDQQMDEQQFLMQSRAPHPMRSRPPQGMWQDHHHPPSNAGHDPYNSGTELLRMLQGGGGGVGAGGIGGIGGGIGGIGGGIGGGLGGVGGGGGGGGGGIGVGSGPSPASMNRFPHAPPDASQEGRRFQEEFFGPMDHGQPMPLGMLPGNQEWNNPRLMHGRGGSPRGMNNLHNGMPHQEMDLPPGMEEGYDYMGRMWGPGPPPPVSPRGLRSPPLGAASPPLSNGPVRSPRARGGYPPNSPRAGGFGTQGGFVAPGSPRGGGFSGPGSPRGAPGFRGPPDFFGEPPMPPSFMSPPPPFPGHRGGGPMSRPPFDPSFSFSANPEPISPHAAPPYGPNFHPDDFFPDSVEFSEGGGGAGGGGGMGSGWGEDGPRGGSMGYGPLRMPGGPAPHRSPQRSPHLSPHRSPVGTPPGRGMGRLHDANFSPVTVFDMREEERSMFGGGGLGDVLGPELSRGFGREGRPVGMRDGGRGSGRRAGRGEGGRRGGRTGGPWGLMGKEECLREDEYGGPFGQRGGEWEGIEGMERVSGLVRGEEIMYNRSRAEERGGHMRGREGRGRGGRGEDGRGMEELMHLRGEEGEQMKGRSQESREETRRRKTIAQEWRMKQSANQGQFQGQDGSGQGSLESLSLRSQELDGQEHHGLRSLFGPPGATVQVVPLASQLDHPGLPSAVIAVADTGSGDVGEVKQGPREGATGYGNDEQQLKGGRNDAEKNVHLSKQVEESVGGNDSFVSSEFEESGEEVDKACTGEGKGMEAGKVGRGTGEELTEETKEDNDCGLLTKQLNQLSFRGLVESDLPLMADLDGQEEGETGREQQSHTSGTSSSDSLAKEMRSGSSGKGGDGQTYPELPDVLALDMAGEMNQHGLESNGQGIGQNEATVAKESSGRVHQGKIVRNGLERLREEQREQRGGSAPYPTQGLQQRSEGRYRSDMMHITSRLLGIFENLIPTAQEENRRRAFLQRLDSIVAHNWGDAKLFLYGSCANAFGVRNSDIDVCLAVEDVNASKPELINRMAAILNAEGMRQVQALTHARVPIVKFVDSEAEVACDICVNNMLAVANTKLLRDYAQVDERLRQLAFLVKHWAKRRQVNETYRGTLSSYAYVMMCIHYLQQRRPPILPCLQNMQPTYSVRIGDIMCSYFDRVDTLREFGAANRESVGELLTGFFEYWGFRHDYNRAVVSVRIGGYISKDQKEWTRRIGNERHLLCIEDPFETSHDLGRVVDRHSMRVLRDEFQRAARVMRHDPDPCTTLFSPYVREENEY